LGEKLGDIQENNENRDEQIAIVNDMFDQFFRGSTGRSSMDSHGPVSLSRMEERLR